ncbi:efflux transporter outer membrane subunit [Mitsuaria sp. BK037]|uniref:efflux transporter outer membrane subunit n=1 Tax=Mitsuaria sp. BK037 TaxID=2587122 RepID=UPI00160B5E95|nr:efflux transporter outer membrane subunit [Mitsuaria sp. BK037]MBB3283946.1 multidrug efflux system outer membrane protein [Mitsuaria sp. BK037]
MMFFRVSLMAAAAAATVALTGCSTAPAPKKSEVPLASGFANAPQGDAGTLAQAPVGRFWQGFNDAGLDALVQRALQANTDLRVASANLREARALSRFADAQLFPTVDLNAGAARVRAPDYQGNPQTNNAFSVGFDVRWEADLFGRLSDERRAAAADLLAGEAGLRSAQVSVAAEVARNYFELRGLQEQLRVAQQSLDTQQGALKLVAGRQEAGRGTGFDTERARALVQSTAATIPALEMALARTRYRLAVLTGQPPTALDVELSDVKPLPGLKTIALDRIGTPEDLLRRRPDVRAAEAQVAAAAARVGVARSAMFPRVTLGGTIGQNASRIGDLNDGPAYAYNLGAQLVWNLLDFGRIRAQIAAADARNEAAFASYERTVLAALEETEGALVTYNRSQQQAQALFDAAVSAERAANIARERFKVGISDFLAVLDAERELLTARNQLAQSQTAAATSLVGVYKALAGGIDGEAPAQTAAR